MIYNVFKERYGCYTSKTTADLIANTRTLLDEAQPEDFTADEVLYQVNYAYHFVVSKVIEIYEEFYLTTTPKMYSTVANQQQYTLDTTLLKFERVEINYDPTVNGSVAQRATALKLEELPLSINNTLVDGSSLFNAGYFIIGSQGVQKIGFVPIPQITATNNISVWGIEAPSDLVNDTDPVLIPYPDNFAQIISKVAAANLLKKGQQEVQAAGDLLNEANVDILNMQTFISERQSDSANMISELAYDDINLGSYIY